MTELPRLTYRPNEVAEMLGVSAPTIHTLVRKGQLRAIRPSPGSILIPADAITEWIKRQPAAYEPEPPVSGTEGGTKE